MVGLATLSARCALLILLPACWLCGENCYGKVSASAPTRNLGIQCERETAPRDQGSGLDGGQDDEIRDNELRRRVQRWLVILADPRASLAQRTAAERQLIALGPVSLPYLRDLNHAAGQASLTRIRNELEQQQEQQASEPQQFDLKFIGTLADALQLLAEKSGNSIQFGEIPEEQIELSLESTHFWPALDQLLRDANLRLALPNTRSDPWRFEHNGSTDSLSSNSICYSSLFRIEPVRKWSQTHFRNPELNQQKVELEVTWEPRLKPLVIRLPTKSISAKIRVGSETEPATSQPVTVSQTRNSFTNHLSTRSTKTRFQIPFQIHGTNSTGPNWLEGEFIAETLGPSAEFVWDSLAEQTFPTAPIRKGSAEVQIVSVVESNGKTEITIQVNFQDAGDALESFQQWSSQNPLRLIDEAGRMFKPDSSVSQGQQKNQFRCLYSFSDLPGLKSLKLSYSTPTTILKVSVPFQLVIP